VYLAALLKGFLIGSLIAVPVGPVAVLCLQRALNAGPRAAVASGLGVAFADSLGAAVALLGITFISSFLAAQERELRTIAALFLCLLGARLLCKRIVETRESGLRREAQNLLSVFLLTFFSPATVPAFLAAFAGFGVARESLTWAAAAALLAGVFLGSFFWWGAIGAAMILYPRRPTLLALTRVSRASGVLLVAAGLAMLGGSWL
jgi:threonine/homoserine/homoserine lactone efflux protein